MSFLQDPRRVQPCEDPHRPKDRAQGGHWDWCQVEKVCTLPTAVRPHARELDESTWCAYCLPGQGLLRLELVFVFESSEYLSLHADHLRPTPDL